MIDLETSIADLRQQVDALRQGLAGELDALASACETARAQAAKSQLDAGEREQRLRELEESAEGHNELIETLKQDAEKASRLQDEVRERDLEIEKLASELESKKDLVQALRQQVKQADVLNSLLLEAEATIRGQQQELDEAQEQIGVLHQEVDVLRAEASMEPAADSAELEALHAELEARKTMIKSLREDVGRLEGLEIQLEAKRETIGELEQSIERHVQTIDGLRQSVNVWRKKYQAVKGELSNQGETLDQPPAFTETELDVLTKLENTADAADATSEEAKVDATAAERTLAINMRDALSQVREQKSQKTG